jgi:hypothetical protein
VAINNWLSADPLKHFWMEATGRNDLGAKLHSSIVTAPLAVDED